MPNSPNKSLKNLVVDICADASRRPNHLGDGGILVTGILHEANSRSLGHDVTMGDVEVEVAELKKEGVLAAAAQIEGVVYERVRAVGKYAASR